MTPSDHLIRAPRTVLVVAVLAALAMVASACGGDSDGAIGSGAEQGDASASSTAVEGSSDDDGPTTTDATPSTVAGQDEDEDEDGEKDKGEGDGADPTVWVGRYVWEEVADGGPGSNQVLVHELVLRLPGDGGGPVTGTLTQSGFQTATEFTVAAEPVVDGVAIRVASVDGGLTSMEPGDIAVTLTGDPADPVTTVGTLLPLVVERPTSGRYFVPDGDRAGGDIDESARAGGIPATFWAVEVRSFDLIEIDVDSGAEVGRIPGWGAPPGGDPSLVLQALQRVDVSPAGWLWVDDCCEPAFGNVFGLDPASITDLEQVFGSAASPDGRQLVGLNPVTSPDGSLMAWGNGPFEVTVADGRGDAVGSVLAGDDETFAIPVAWLDATTLAAAVAGVDETTITFWDLSTPAAPVPLGSPQVVPGLVADAARGEAGTIVVVFGPQPVTDPDRSGVVLTPNGMEPIEVPDGVVSIDRDPSGRHLLWVGADGLARLGPLGSDAPVLSGIEVISASW